jgi:hypothetical protein
VPARVPKGSNPFLSAGGKQEEGPQNGPSSPPEVGDPQVPARNISIASLSEADKRAELMNEHPQDLEMDTNADERADLPTYAGEVESELSDDEAINRVRNIDKSMEGHRQAMAALAGLRDEAVRELVETTSIPRAAEALGVTRQAIYKAFQERQSLTPAGASMSTGLTQRKIEQLQKDISRLQQKIAKETSNQVSLSNRLGRTRQQQGQTRSSATAQSKQREAERLERDIVASQRRRANSEKEVARKTEELHRNQNKLVKEQASERDRLLRRLEATSRERDQAALSGLAKQTRWNKPGERRSVAIDRMDVFISHATEDKDEVARPLAEELRRLGLRVWYDEFELKVGDSLRRKIDDGLTRSRFGIVVLSPKFFAKNWPQYELDGLVAKEMQDRRKIILPLWHRVSKDEVIRYSPNLSDKVALSTSQFTIVELAKKLAQAME